MLPVCSRNLVPSESFPLQPLRTIHSTEAPQHINGIPISNLPPITEIVLEPTTSVDKLTCGDRVRAVANKIGQFIKTNWKYVLLYMLAWSLILVCYHTIAATLTIWLGIGLGSGIIFGVFTANVLDKNNKYKQVNSLWNLINHGLQQLDPHGTRQFLLATVIAAISSLIYTIPEAIGFSIGAALGNQLSIAAVYGLRLRDDEHSLGSDTLKKIQKIKKQINQYQIIKQQILLQKQIDALSLQLNSPTITASLESIKLHSNLPLSYFYDITYPHRNDTTLYPEHADTSIQVINTRILSLMQTLALLRQKPNHILEDD